MLVMMEPFLVLALVVLVVAVLVVAVIAAAKTVIVVTESCVVGGESPGIIVILCKCNGFRL